MCDKNIFRKCTLFGELQPISKKIKLFRRKENLFEHKKPFRRKKSLFCEVFEDTQAENLKNRIKLWLTNLLTKDGSGANSSASVLLEVGLREVLL